MISTSLVAHGKARRPTTFVRGAVKVELQVPIRRGIGYDGDSAVCRGSDANELIRASLIGTVGIPTRKHQIPGRPYVVGTTACRSGSSWIGAATHDYPCLALDRFAARKVHHAQQGKGLGLQPVVLDEGSQCRSRQDHHDGCDHEHDDQLHDRESVCRPGATSHLATEFCSVH